LGGSEESLKTLQVLEDLINNQHIGFYILGARDSRKDPEGLLCTGIVLSGFVLASYRMVTFFWIIALPERVAFLPSKITTCWVHCQQGGELLKLL
jgi:hypothetical protein